MLRTTINMKSAVFVKIELAANHLGISKRGVVILLLMRVRKDFSWHQGGFSLVKYQARDPLKRWHRFTITFREKENELFSDFRRLGKLSVSFFVSKAVEKYLDELLHAKGESHNYVDIDQYAIGQSAVDGVICWEFYWGPMPKRQKKRKNAKIIRITFKK